ncbi:hypothetical protein LX99_04506 [Mucilaginibacter oryzae]|uniref:Uncharacterized protein n=1 Tax=Mucilaginibacter oryzae TaxID=468058 RepID=A0A316H1M2_9SPHI|nr:hypothetical protein [Mucilaginibacter oryzae]PWK71482.1 hypothetical protein LX99_04506 [Mucilaginibacter oryzae]
MNIIERIGKILSDRSTNPRFISSLRKVKEADRVTESINKQLKELDKKMRRQTVNS